MNVYIRNNLMKRIHKHNIEDVPTFVCEALEKALDILDLKEDA